MDEIPVLISCKPLKSDYQNYAEISITSDEISLGRGTNNAIVIPFPSISRNHCLFKKSFTGDWTIEDNSTFGIDINGTKLGKGCKRKLSNDDVISLEPCGQFIYKFTVPCDNDFETPRKRMKLQSQPSDITINSMKTKFAESQSFELKHFEEKIQNTQQMLTTSKVLKDQLQQDMHKKIKQLDSDYEIQIKNLKGEKNDVEMQKLLLMQERDEQLRSVKKEMEGKIKTLKDQIEKHNVKESQLLSENNLLKEKLLREREEFLNDLNRESSSKQDILAKLEQKIKEQEEIRKKEKIEMEEILRKETERLKQANEKELKELEKEKLKCELKLKNELDIVKRNFQEQVEQTDLQRRQAEQQLNEKLEEMKKQNRSEKLKMEQLIKEREVIQMKLSEAQVSAEKSLEHLKAQVTERETELAALAAERIQMQAQQSGEVIQNLQEQLEKVKNQLENVESEKQTLLEQNISNSPGEGSSKQSTLTKVGELMESELQCSICAELFVEAITLNCSHTFCKYCITKWKKKKKDCPICRSSITNESKSLVLDSFIDKMVQNLTQEMKTKREEMLKARQELEKLQSNQGTSGMRRRNSEYEYSYSTDADEGTATEEDSEENDYYQAQWSTDYGLSDTDSRLDYDSGDELIYGATDFSSTTGILLTRNTHVPGRPGSYYGGYGNCFNCGASGHWAPGCPFS